MGDRTRLGLIIVVTTVWAANFAASLIPALQYETDQAINGIFMVIIGALFATSRGGGAPPAPPGGAHAERHPGLPDAPPHSSGGSAPQNDTGQEGSHGGPSGSVEGSAQRTEARPWWSRLFAPPPRWRRFRWLTP